MKREKAAMKGKILKIKTGYNPNSSSVGADIVVFFTAGAAAAVLFNATAALIFAAQLPAEPSPEVAGQAGQEDGSQGDSNPSPCTGPSGTREAKP